MNLLKIDVLIILDIGNRTLMASLFWLVIVKGSILNIQNAFAIEIIRNSVFSFSF